MAINCRLEYSEGFVILQAGNPNMILIIIAVFVLGYVAIAFEHAFGVNKAASAMITGTLCWTIYIFNTDSEVVNHHLMEHLGQISSILFFLLGAMTIVELIDSHNGFESIKRKLKTTNKSKLLFLVATLTFFMSAILDNLTTAIVMVSISRNLFASKTDRMWFAGIIIIAANAGGAWSPLGDVTTTMLWIGKQITAANIIVTLILPSLACCYLPVAIVAYKFRGQTVIPAESNYVDPAQVKQGEVLLMLGVAFLLFVPIFKTATDLPPFIGMMLALGSIWVLTSAVKIHKRKNSVNTKQVSVGDALQKIDTPSILFFLGILLAVAALESTEVLSKLAKLLEKNMDNDLLVGTSLGLLSAIVDNVPLVAGAQGMYSLEQFPTDHSFWEFLALVTGTGGSIIIIGSAAGIAIMGIEQINFMWYLKHIGFLAFLGFLAGILGFILQNNFLF